MKAFLPDRERRHLLQFHIAPRMAYGRRLATALALIVAGIAVQFVTIEKSPPAAILGGGGLLLVGNLFLLLKGFDLQPKRTKRRPGWERTTMDRLRRIPELERQVSRWDAAAIDISCPRGFLALLFLGIAPVALAVWVLSKTEGAETLTVLVAVDGLILVLPHWLTGLRKKWKPVALRERVQALIDGVDAIEREADGRVRIQPTFRMAGEEDERVPVDARVFLRFPDGPEDFLGVQFQVSINVVQGTHYPYFYAVIVAKESFGLLDRVPMVERIADGLTVESTTEDDAHVIVIRQHTTEKSGYHTHRRAVARIAAAAWQGAGVCLEGDR